MKKQVHSNNLPVSEPLIVVASSSFSKSLFLRKKIEEKFSNVVFNELGRPLSESELTKFLKDADAVIIGLEPINDRILAQAPRLKIISKYGVGLDNIEEISLERRNIFLGWKGGVNRRSVAELTLCFMLGLFRNIFSTGFKLKKTEWEKDGGTQLTGKTIGIIGCGHIGSEVIRLLEPFQCKVLVNDIVDKSKFCEEFNTTKSNLEDIIGYSDLISLHTSLTSLTKGMVDTNFLHQMKPTSFLINTSRGSVIDQKALKEALKTRKIAGAALDVFGEEPVVDQEFLSLPNLMVTPHIAGNARESVETMGQSAINHLVCFFKNSKDEDLS